MDPALFPQWHKAAKSSAGGGAGNAGSSARSGSGVFARNGLSVGDRSLTREKDLNPNPYSNFGVGRRRERKRELETRGKDRASVVDNGFEASSKVSRLRRPDSTVVGRSVDPPKRVGSGTRNGVVTRGNVVGGSGKALFERDFPLLKEKQRDADRASSHVLSSLPKGTFGGHAAQTPDATTGARNMAEALARAPRVRTPPEIDANKQRMEEMALSKVKRLIPVTPSMPKSSVLNSSDKSRSKGARVDLSGPSKVGQHSSSQLVNHTLRAPLRTDIPKPQPGNFQILKRERDGVSFTSKDAPTVSRVISPTKAVSSSACPPLKDPLSSKLQSVCKVTTLTSTHNSFKDKAPLIRAQKRNDFFNALRKKTSTNNLCAGCDPSSDDLTGLEKSGEHSSGSFSSNLVSGKLAEQIFGSISMGSEKLGVESSGSSSSNLENNLSASSSGFNFSIENVNGVTGDFNVCEISESCLSDYGENRHQVPAIDAEKEKALLKDLGWEEDAREEALTPEEIGTFLKKYEKQTPSLKLPHCKFHGLMADLLRKGVTDRASSSSSVCTAEARVC